MPEPNTRARTWLSCLPAFLFAVYPLSIVVGRNIADVPADMISIGRSLVTALAAVAVLLVVLRPLLRDAAVRGLWLAWVVLSISVYGLVVAELGTIGVHISTSSVPFAAAYTMASVGLATAIVRPWQARPRDPIPINLVAAILLTVNIAPVVSFALWPVPWRPKADALIAGALSAAAPGVAPDRDIYYVILDSFGSAATLQRRYDVDLAPFVAFLKSRGFQVPDRSQSNYSQTYLALASAVSLDYLDGIASAMGPENPDRRPLGYLIETNPLMMLARRAGYHVVGVSSDYMATTRLDAADECYCAQYGIRPISRVTIGLTSVAPFVPHRWTDGAHRRKVEESFRTLGDIGTEGPRQFVFAHIVSPHPPFVFHADGSARTVDTYYSLNDGDAFPGSADDYVTGYRDQVRFVVSRMTRLIDSLLSRPGPKPVIVIHGDHGPGSRLRMNDPAATDMAERMGIFAAYYFPDREAAIAATITPVNGARFLATTYLGAALPPLPDRSLFSTWDRPYAFVPVSPAREPEQAPASAHQNDLVEERRGERHR